MRKLGALAAGSFIALAVMASPASAASANWTGTLDSGGSYKAFETTRTATVSTVSNYVSKGASGGIGIGFIGCTNFTTVAGEQNIGTGGTAYHSGMANKCFRQNMHRTVAANTNGSLPGNGTTDVAGQIIW